MEISRTNAQKPSQSQTVKEVQNSLRSAVSEAAEQKTKAAEKRTEQAKPVVNSQGQTIGTRLNVSA